MTNASCSTKKFPAENISFSLFLAGACFSSFNEMQLYFIILLFLIFASPKKIEAEKRKKNNKSNLTRMLVAVQSGVRRDKGTYGFSYTELCASLTVNLSFQLYTQIELFCIQINTYFNLDAK